MSDAFNELQRLPENERLAALDLLVSKRKQNSFIKYFVPWSEQLTALKTFTSDKKVVGLLGGNRSGKTILGAFLSIAWCLGKEYFKGEPVWDIIKNLPIPEPPNNVWVVGLDYGVLRDVIWYEKLRYGKNHPPFIPKDSNIVRNISDRDFQIMFENGSLLTGKSADAGREKFQGASIDLVWIDEECDVSIYDECFQRTVDCAGKVLLTLTPLLDVNSGVKEPWVYDLYQDFKEGQKDLSFCQLSTINSPFVPEEEKQRLLAKWKGDPEEGARLYGDFVRRSGLVYPAWDRDKHLIELNTIPKHWQRIVSIDPAATGVTAAIWLAIDDSGNMYAFREYYERERIVSEHAKSIKILCAGEPVDIWLLDPKWGSQRNAETHKTGAQLWRDAGLPVRLPNVGEDYGLHVSREYINATIEPNPRNPKFYVVKDSCPNFEFEIAHYTYDTFSKGVLKGQSKDKPRKSHDHLLNAWQYACTLRLMGKKNRHLIRREISEWDEMFNTKIVNGQNKESYT